MTKAGEIIQFVDDDLSLFDGEKVWGKTSHEQSEGFCSDSGFFNILLCGSGPPYLCSVGVLLLIGW